MSIILLVVLLVAIGTFIAGVVKKSKPLISAGIVLGLIFAGLFYIFGLALSGM